MHYVFGRKDDNIAKSFFRDVLNAEGLLSRFPSAGAGFDLTRNVGVDTAFFGTQTLLQGEPHLGLAISMRIDKR